MSHIQTASGHCLLVVIFAWTAIAAHAQQEFGRGKVRKGVSPQNETLERRTVDLDILVQSQPSYRVKAQEWGRAFQELGYTPQFRRPQPGEALRIEDVDHDGKLTVHIVGGMSVDGTIQIGNQRFTIADAAKMRACLDELAAYGAGGPPAKSPKWGMTEEQLLDFMKRLSQPLAEDVVLATPLATLESMGLPADIRMTFMEQARGRALGRRPESAPEILTLRGYSQGTAAAIVLSQFGLGFRPRRIAANSYEIEIDAGGESDNLWPTGWKAQETTAELLPAYLKPIKVDVKDTEVSALLEVVTTRLKVQAFQSTFALAAADKDLDELTYTREDRVSPSKLLSSIGDKLQLGFDLRVDEGGKLFLWVTTADESKAFRTRFAHVKQTIP